MFRTVRLYARYTRYALGSLAAVAFRLAGN